MDESTTNFSSRNPCGTFISHSCMSTWMKVPLKYHLKIRVEFSSEIRARFLDESSIPCMDTTGSRMTKPGYPMAGPSLFWHFRKFTGGHKPPKSQKPSQFKGEISKNRKNPQNLNAFQNFFEFTGGTGGRGCTQRRPWFLRNFSKPRH